MHFSRFMEDYLEFEDWHNRDNEDVNFSDSSSDERLMSKLKSTDHYFRKQGFSDLFLFLQHNTNIDVFPSIFEEVKRFSSDEEPTLRCDFAESLITITKLTIPKNSLKWNCVENFTIPSALNLLHDPDKQIRLASHATVIFLIENKLLVKDLFLEDVYPILEEIMVSYNPDELRIECFTLLVKISGLLHACLENQILRFCRDFITTNDNLRKSCASLLSNIISWSTDTYLKDWLEIFYKLSEDISWYIKKLCIECAVLLSKKVSKEERVNKLANVYYGFMTDSKKWVVTCAYQHFGAFIATFADPSKALCKISDQGKIVTVRLPLANISTEMPETTKTTESISVKSEDSFGNIFFWQQPINNKFITSMSPEVVSVKDIDINEPDSSDQPQYSWPPDLSHYKQEIIPIKLLQCYSNTIHEICEIDLIRQCAFSMPAVLVTLGPSCWSFLKSPYIKLVQFMSWKVRLCLASSLHHVFQIFKYNDDAVKDLIWTYKELIKDVDEVKTGLMANVSEFYLAISIEQYPLLFEDFDDLIHLDNRKNWRYREICMEQLETLITNMVLQTPEHSSIFTDLVSYRWIKWITNYSEDYVSAVRLAAGNTLVAALKKLWTITVGKDGDNEHDLVRKGIQERLIRYSEVRNWYMRQFFLRCVIKMVVTNTVTSETLDSIIIPKYLYLCCRDKVPNNRVVGGQGLEQICSHGYFMSCSPEIRKMMETTYHQMKRDRDRDVRDSVDKLSSIFVTATP